MEVAQRVKMEFTQITLDRATIARLRLAAEGKPLAQYIRELSLGLPAPLERKLNSMEAKLDNTLVSTGFYTKDTEGNMVPVRAGQSKVVFQDNGAIDHDKSSRGESVFEALQRMEKEGGH